MKNSCLLICFLLLGIINKELNAQNLNFDWAKIFEVAGSAGIAGKKVELDPDGNIYSTGKFSGTIDFDPGPGTHLLGGSGYDIYVSKLDSNGNFLWAKKFGSPSNNDEPFDMVVDDTGNVYTCGIFYGTVDFDPSPSTFNLTSNGGRDIFISKLDSSGNFLWAKRMGGFTHDFGMSISFDGFGGLLVSGYFDGTVDFDPSPTVLNVSSNGNWDAFVCKLDLNGNLVWVKNIGGVSNDEGYAVCSDNLGNVYLTGHFLGTVDFDSSPSTYNLGTSGLFILKLDMNGNFVWAKRINTSGKIHEIYTNDNFDVYYSGYHNNVADFDPDSILSYNVPLQGGYDGFISKLDSNGNFLWVKSFAGSGQDEVCGMKIYDENIYSVGYYENSVDLNLGNEVRTFTSLGYGDVFIMKMDEGGNIIWVETLQGTHNSVSYGIDVNSNNELFYTGFYIDDFDFDPSDSVYLGGTPNITVSDGFVCKFKQQGVFGKIFLDYNENCQRENFELGLEGRLVLVNPGSYISQTNQSGVWVIDSLPNGTYTVQLDTSDTRWKTTCSPIQSFNITNSNSVTEAPHFGQVSNYPCASPDISLVAPIIRRGFFNQKVYVKACNQISATEVLDSAHVILELNQYITPQLSSIPYTNLGNHRYKFELDSIFPSECVNFWVDCQVSINAAIGQTICLQAELFPVDSCVLDTIPSPNPVITSLGTVSPCFLPWDKSSLRVEGECINNDSIRFVIYNTGDFGDGDMDCWSPVRVYIDGQLIILDSIQLLGGDSVIYMFEGTGSTWRLEADQHPLHPGNSHPNASVELCGSGNWTPNLVNILPQDDADPVIDIFCGVVSGSYDPNDKRGYPIGVGVNNDIQPNQDIEYVIRFQNTGTDTAFTVVIRDTLSPHLNVFSIQSGVGSHDYNFRMYDSRVLEWTFNNIMLPDSNVNEPLSHGFISFKAKQQQNLPLGTIINNTAAIYFDFNVPIITNTTTHTINEYNLTLSLESTENEIENWGVRVYPNPTNSLINIDKRINKDLELLVVDNLGRTLYENILSNSKSFINISEFPIGVYFLIFKNDNEVKTYKVVKY